MPKTISQFIHCEHKFSLGGASALKAGAKSGGFDGGGGGGGGREVGYGEGRVRRGAPTVSWKMISEEQE